jgi:hypothetical protein
MPVSDFRCWHVLDMQGRCEDVRYLRNTGSGRIAVKTRPMSEVGDTKHISFEPHRDIGEAMSAPSVPMRKSRPGGHRTADFRNCRLEVGSIAVIFGEAGKVRAVFASL